MQPSEIDRMVFFEYEYMLDDIKDYQKEKQTQAEAQEKQQAQMQKQIRNPMGNYKLPSMPSAPQMPKISMPKFG